MTTPTLISFGPTRSVPPGYAWCSLCDGTGEHWAVLDGVLTDEKITCPCCRGKGHHNGADIDQYHANWPSRLKKECYWCMAGKPHPDPVVRKER